MNLMTVVRGCVRSPQHFHRCGSRNARGRVLWPTARSSHGEVVEAAEAVVGDGLATYKVSDKVLIEVPLTAAEAAERATEAADRFRKVLANKLADRKLTCAEANELAAAAAMLTIDAIEGRRP